MEWLSHFVGNVSKATHSTIEMLCMESVPRVGDYVCAEYEGAGVVGRVSEVILNRDSGESLARANLFSSVEFDPAVVHSGVLHTPSIGDRVFFATTELIRAVAELGSNEHDQVSLDLCQLFGYDIPLSFSPERLFGRHLAIVGTTGGGKSWSVARLVEECAKYQGKVILFDPSGEYSTLKKGVSHVSLGVGEVEPHITPVSLPYWELTEGDLFTIFRPSGEAQAPKLRAAIKSLKLAKLEPNLAPGGIILKAHRDKKEFNEAYARHLSVVEGSGASFDVRKLAAQIHNECVNPQSSPVEPNIWGGPNGVDQSLCATLISRVEDIVSNPQLAPIFKPEKDQHSLLAVIDAFIKEPRKQVLCVSLEHLSFAYGVRETVMNALGRRLLDRARKNYMVTKPTLVIVDEAHQFINSQSADDLNSYSLNSFSLIAKEGRKYGLTACLATQRPRDIPESVLSQMGTIIIHRLTSENDVSLVEKASGSASLASIANVATFSPGEGIVIGSDFPVPLLIQMLPPSARPVSRGSNYQEYWKGSSRVVSV